MKLPASPVDPAWPVAPDLDDDELGLLAALPEPRQSDLIARERRDMRQRVAALHVQTTRLLLLLHQAQRAQRAQPPAAAPSAAPARRRGRPHMVGRNDRLLWLFENRTPARLPHLQRCRIAAQLLAADIAASAGLPATAGRVLPDTTARDAIAEARRRRMPNSP